MAIYGWCILLPFPLVFAEIYLSFVLKWPSRFQKGTRLQILSVPALILLPILLHPVWDLFLNPRTYQELDQQFGEGTSRSIRLTSARDWFLLDEHGQHWFNSWYYGAAPILMERERVTSFQPMVVAMVGMDPKNWRPEHKVHFSTEKGSRGQRLHLFQATSPSDLDDAIARNQLDYVAIDSSLAGNHLADSWGLWPKGSYGFFSNGVWPQADGVLRHDRNTFWAKQEKMPDGVFYRTPLVERKLQLHNQGLDPEQTRLADQYKQLLFAIASKPVWMGCLGLFGGVGFLLTLSGILSPLARLRPGLLPVLGLLCTLLLWRMWSDTFHYRMSTGKENFWAQHEVLKKASFTLTQGDVQSVLEQPLAEDARLRILQWLILGRSYPRMPAEVQIKIVEVLGSVVETYPSLPFNLRYKLLDACSNVPPLHSSLSNLVVGERHPYVRWYAREKGLDPL